MDPLYELRDLLASVEDIGKTPKKDHKKIYEYIERVVLSPKSPIIKQVPPLDVVIYSINKILLPTLITPRIPNLLDLLATVEFYRKRTLASTHEATVWNDYYQVQNENIITRLSSEDEAYFKNLESDSDTMRTMYITIIAEFCQLDMHLLLTARPSSISNFIIRFNEYFPNLNEHYHRNSPRLFWSDLSPQETHQLSELGTDCCGRVQKIVDWALNHTESGFVKKELLDLGILSPNAFHSEAFHPALWTQDFDQAFPMPFHESALSELILYYTTKVFQDSEKVKSIFSP